MRKHVMNLMGSEKVAHFNQSLQLYLKEVEKVKRLDPSEERAYLISAKNGDLIARDRLVLSHVKFVVKVAAQFQNRNTEIADLINIGNIGLITAIEKFDLTKECKFISAAVFWVRSAILEYIKETQFVRIPHNRINDISHLKKLVEKESQKAGYDMSYLDFVIDIEEKEEGHKKRNVKKESDRTIDSISRAFFCTEEKETIDYFKEGDENDPKASYLYSNNILDSHNVFESKDRELRMNFYFKHLTEDEKKLFIFKHGIYDNQEKTCKEVATYFSMSTIKTKSLLDNATEKLRRAVKLENFN